LIPKSSRRLHLCEDFLDGARAGVTSGLRTNLSAADRRHIIVYVRRGFAFSPWADELAAVEAGLRQREVAGERAIRLHRQGHRGAFLNRICPPASSRRRDVEQHAGAAKRRDVAAVSYCAAQVRVSGEVVYSTSSGLDGRRSTTFSC